MNAIKRFMSITCDQVKADDHCAKEDDRTEEEEEPVFPLDTLPQLIIERVIDHCDLNTCVNLARISPHIESMIPTHQPNHMIIVLMPTWEGQVASKWKCVENKYNARWTLRVPMDQQEESIQLIKALFQLIPNMVAIRVIDCDLVDLVLKIGSSDGSLANIRLFEYQDTLNLSDKRSDSLFWGIKEHVPQLGRVRYIRYFENAQLLACSKVWEECPQFQY